MRSEKEIMKIILDFAESDNRIRAVAMDGSRVNPNVPKDIFQDYDISYFVTDIESFISDENWIDIFGERIIMQKPETMSLFPPELNNWFTYLMLFIDGNRIDLTLIPINESELFYKDKKLIKIVMDKDYIFPKFPEPSDKDYHVKRPSKDFFYDCCNEFWWVSTYVAKGLCRNEILYANYHLNSVLHPCLLQMMEWRAGFSTNFTQSMGKCSKYISKYTDQNDWNLLLLTFNNSNYENCWKSLFDMILLFRKNTGFVAEKLAIEYPIKEDNNVTEYLNKAYKLFIKNSRNS